MWTHGWFQKGIGWEIIRQEIPVFVDRSRCLLRISKHTRMADTESRFVSLTLPGNGAMRPSGSIKARISSKLCPLSSLNLANLIKLSWQSFLSSILSRRALSSRGRYFGPQCWLFFFTTWIRFVSVWKIALIWATSLSLGIYLLLDLSARRTAQSPCDPVGICWLSLPIR